MITQEKLQTITEAKFLRLTDEEQCEVLVCLAVAVLPVLAEHSRAYHPASDAVSLLIRHLSDPLPSHEAGKFLNHDDLSQDLSALFDFVGDNEDAESALDVICYASGGVAHYCYLQEGKTSGMPDPVLAATPDIVVNALTSYRSLSSNGCVPKICDITLP